MVNNDIIAFFFIAKYLCAVVVAIECSRGERVDTLRNGVDVCIPCKDFTFMAEDNHSYRTCKQCTFIEDHDVDVFVSLCNKTHDSVIFCTSGFYRRKARNDRQTETCEKCTECEFPTRACGGYYDTVCCHPNQEAVLTSGGVYVCRDIPIVCGPGQFFSTSTEECLPCPPGTFMSAHNHTYKECLKCEQISENSATHAVITRPCSRTTPTLFGCKDGYFRDPTQESLQTEVPCTPCRSCQLSLIECHMFHDAACDSKEEPTTTSSSPSGNKYGAASLEISIGKRNQTLGAVENALQSTENKSELHSYIEYAVSEDFWIWYLIIVILFLLSNLILSLISFPKNVKAGQMNDNRVNRLFCFTYPVNEMGLFTLVSILVSLVCQILAAVGKCYSIELMITTIRLSILVVIVNIFIHCMYLNACNKKRKQLCYVFRTFWDRMLCVPKKSRNKKPINVNGNKQFDIILQESQV